MDIKNCFVSTIATFWTHDNKKVKEEVMVELESKDREISKVVSFFKTLFFRV